MRNFLLRTTAFAAVTAASVLAAAPANAGYTHTETFKILSSAHGNQTDGDFGVTNLSIPLFNTTQGKLQSVLVFEKLDASYQGAIEAVTSMAPVTTKVSMTTDSFMQHGPSVLDGPAASNYLVQRLTLSEMTTVSNLSQGHFESFARIGATTKNVYDFQASHSALAVADFEKLGGGFTTAQLHTLTTIKAPKGFKLEDTAAKLTGTITEVFNYTNDIPNIPEPASAFMVGSGVIALGMARRRRKKP